MVDLNRLRDKAKELLVSDDVRRLIGWKRGTCGYEAAPVVLKQAPDVDQLIFDGTCVQNPATHITLEEKLPVPRGQDPDTRRIAVMVKGCDSRAVVQHLVENAYERSSVVILGIPCHGVIDRRKALKMFGEPAGPVSASVTADKVVLDIDGEKKEAARGDILMDKCLRCRYPNPLISDVLLDEKVEAAGTDDFADVADFEKKPPAEKWSFFEEQFSKCIRCYSCRNVCPMCYCVECVITRIEPQWTRRSTDIAENTGYHITRAWHLAGRCIECMECQRVCPVDIPIMTLNRKLTRDVREMFEYEAGTNPEADPMLASFRPNDPEDYIM